MSTTRPRRFVSPREDGAVLHLVSWMTFIAMALLASSARAEEGMFTGSVEVNVVNLRVMVTDLLGRPVTDLEREDFAVFEDGERQQVTHFAQFEELDTVGRDAARGISGYGPATAHAEVSSAGSVPPPHLVVLAFDLGSIWKPRLRSAVDQTRDLVLAEAEPGVEWSVVAVGQESVCLVPPTPDPERVAAGLEQVMTAPGAGVPLRIAQAGSLLDLPGLRGLSCRFAADPRAAALADTVGGLAATFLAHAWRPGPKSCVYLYQSGGPAPAGCRSSSLSSDATQRLSAAAMSLSEAARQAATCGFTVYATDVYGLEDPTWTPTSNGTSVIHRPVRPNQLFDSSTAAHILAGLTGGDHFVSNTPGHAVREAVRDSHQHYSIGYTRDRAHDGEAHQIDVNVPGHRFLVVRHLSEVYDLDPRLLLAQQLSAPLQVLPDQGAIPVELDLSARTVGEQVEVTVDASVGGGDLVLLPSADGLEADLHVFVAVHGEDGQLVAMRETEERIAVPGHQAEGGRVRIGRRLTLRLPAQIQTVTVALYDRASGLTGLASRVVLASAPAGRV